MFNNILKSNTLKFPLFHTRLSRNSQEKYTHDVQCVIKLKDESIIDISLFSNSSRGSQPLHCVCHLFVYLKEINSTKLLHF